MLFVGLLLLSIEGKAQSNLRSRTVRITSTRIVLKDSLPIFPQSVEVSFLPSNFKIYKNNTLVQGDSIILNISGLKVSDSLVKFQYRVLDRPEFASLKLMDTSQISKQTLNPFLAYQFSEDQKVPSLGFGNLNYRGSISRSILAGNNQDLSLSSNLNLQFSGKIDPETEIAAVITDNNIPIQPDGATRQIQEFDKIYIQVTRKKTSLLAGDYEIGSPDGYFMKYYKKLRGATLTNTSQISESTSLQSKASFAISRGKFNRMIINGIEGNQGPYKLVGADGESFIIILSGTEKIYLDGIVLQRGLQDDYTIDYNRGDFSFTPKRLISKDSRIIVEFEYVVQNYVRSIVTLSEKAQINKTTIGVNVYSEQDSKNLPGSLQLSPAEKLALVEAGDSLSLAAVISIDSSSTDPIKYRLIDSLGFTSILVYSSDPKTGKYTANFSFVGNGNGNYILDSNQGVNGRIFKWVAPDQNGKSTGNYSAIKKLIPPTLQQLASILVNTPLTSNMNLNAELAYSKLDKNRFSSLDSKDNNGFAGKVSLTRVDSLGKLKKNIVLSSFAEMEYISTYFKALNPFRNAEFNRDYNYKPLSSEEIWLNAGIGIKLGKTFSGKYTYNRFNQGSLFNAQKHDFTSVFTAGRWSSSLAGSELLTKGNFETTNYFRPKYELSRSFMKDKNFIVKFYSEAESNTRKSLMADTLLASSFRYITFGSQLNFTSKKGNISSINASRRSDYLADKSSFDLSTIADQLSFETNFKLKQGQSFQIVAQYRNLKLQSQSNTLKSGDNYLGRIQHNITTKDNTINNTLVYELSSGQEQKLDYYYQEVNAGLGQYEYNDYNNDGIKQLDEFEIATTVDKAKYIRLIVLSNEFVKTDNISVNENLNLGFPDKWASKTGLKKILHLLTMSNSFQLNRKLKSAEFGQIINPFSKNDTNTQLALLTYFYNSVLQVNRGKPGYEIQLGINGNNNSQLLTSGIEGRTANEYFQFTRINLNPTFQFENRISINNSKSQAELFKSKNYTINSYKIEPALIWNKNLSTRLSLKGKYEKGNTVETVEGLKLESKQLVAEVKHNVATKSSITGKLSFTDIQFSGNQQSPAGFGLLQGLNNGKNFQLSIDMDYKLTKKLYLVLGYEGRKLGISKLVHVFRTQVKAEF